MSVLPSDRDAADAMLLIQQKECSDDTRGKQNPASMVAVGTKRKIEDATLRTQVFAPNRAKKKKKIAAPKNKNNTGSLPGLIFNGYDDDNWQMQEVYDIELANVPLSPERSPTQRLQVSQAESFPSRKAKFLAQTGKGVALKEAEKPRPGNNRVSKANAGAGAAVQLRSDVAPDLEPSLDRYKLEIELLKRQIAERTAKLEEVVRRKSEAVSLNQRPGLWRAVPAQQPSRSAAPGKQQRNGASASHPVNQSNAASALSASTNHLQKQVAHMAGS